MRILLAIPILGLLVVLQSAIVSRLPLLHGTADLVLLALIAWTLQDRVEYVWLWAFIGGTLMSFLSAVPAWVPLISYMLVAGFAYLIKQRIWKTPILAMFATTLIGTLLTHSLTIVMLQVNGIPFPFVEALNWITLPSVLLNMLLAVPVYVLFRELAAWMYPEEIEA